VRVLHVAEVGRGGVVTVMDSLIAGQCNAPQVEEVLRLCSGELTCAPHPKIREIRYRRTGRDARSQWALVVALARTLLREQVDVVHLHSSFAGAWGRLLSWALCLGRPKPVIVYTPHGFSFLASSRLATIYALVEKTLSNRCSAIVCVSRHERDAALRHGLPAGNLHVIHNGVPAQPDYPKEQDDRLRVLFVGRFDRQKGFDVLLDALAIAQLRDQICVRAVGAAYRDHNWQVPPQSTVECLGWLTPVELESQYRWADLVVVPSRWEGFAMVPLEAMSFGCAVVASDCCSLPEAVEDGVSGFLFETGNVQRLAAILGSCPAEIFRRMGRAAAARQRRDFDLATMTRRTSALYKTLKKAPTTSASRTAHERHRRGAP
jgi:glycosyltransferase involved in cell wall biosynthesis